MDSIFLYINSSLEAATIITLKINANDIIYNLKCVNELGKPSIYKTIDNYRTNLNCAYVLFNLLVNNIMLIAFNFVFKNYKTFHVSLHVRIILLSPVL